MRDDLKALSQEAAAAIGRAESESDLQALKAKYLGRRGTVTAYLRQLPELPPKERPAFGQAVNAVKEELEELIARRRALLSQRALQAAEAKRPLDVTLPGRARPRGRLHPITQVMEEILGIFLRLGFSIAEGPEAEWDYYNFEALNIPRDHPARDMHDTFYLNDDILLRTHTSPVQIRVMEAQGPPVQVVAPGKVYRCDADISHSPMFHQVEGLWVDEGVTFADLRGTLETFVHHMFGPKVSLRFRPSFFPFTEPSAEVDIACVMCGGEGCRVCGGVGWLEILGAGMVHPGVYRFVNYDPQRVTGFAFGLGVERIAMLKHRIDDIRLFFENDLRFLSQF